MKKDKEEQVCISKKEYEELLKAYEKLNLLEAYGVDNWCGYDDAVNDEDEVFGR